MSTNGPSRLEDKLVLERPSSDSLPAASGFLCVLQERWRIIACTFAVAVAAGAAYAWLATPVFEATAKLYIERREPIVTWPAEPSNVPLRDYDYLSTQIELIVSDVVLRDAMHRGRLGELETLQNGLSPLETLAEKLQIEQMQRRRQKTQVLELSCESPYPHESVQIVDAVVQSYLAFYERTHKKTTADILNILDQQRKKLARELQEKENALLAFRQKHHLLFSESDQTNPALKRLLVLEDELASAQVERVSADAEYRALQRIRPDPTALRAFLLNERAAYGLLTEQARSMHAAIQQRQTQALASDLRLDELALTRGAKHPHVKAMQRTADAWTTDAHRHQEEYDAYLNRAGEGLLTAVKVRLDAAREKETELLNLSEAQTKKALSIDHLTCEHALLVRDLERTNRAFDVIVERTKELNLAEDYGSLAIQVISPPLVSEEAVRPRKVRVMATACLMGLVAGSVLAFLVDLRDASLRSTDDLEQALGLTVLGALPKTTHASRAGGLALWIRTEPRSPEAEAMRTIRTALHFRKASGDARSLAVTGPNPGEGKTTVAAGLAVSLAQNGVKVLLVDADLRNPGQHAVFSVANDRGLVTHLRGEHGPEAAIVCTDVPNLHVMPAGSAPASAAELLSCDAFATGLAWAAAHYDRVIIDTPPVLSVTDPTIVAALADGVIFVVRLGSRTTRHQACAAVRALSSVGANVVGAVGNAFAKRDPYAYDSYLHRQQSKANRRKPSQNAGVEPTASLRPPDCT